MNVSYEGIGQWAATFACDGVSTGQVVKVSGNGTVAKCADNDGFEGVVLSVARDGKACSVAMGGMVTVRQSGGRSTAVMAETLRQTAERLMHPYAASGKFCFRGVRG